MFMDIVSLHMETNPQLRNSDAYTLNEEDDLAGGLEVSDKSATIWHVAACQEAFAHHQRQAFAVVWWL